MFIKKIGALPVALALAGLLSTVLFLASYRSLPAPVEMDRSRDGGRAHSAVRGSPLAGEGGSVPASAKEFLIEETGEEGDHFSVTAYVTKDGDTLWSIAGSFGLSPDTLIGSNPPDKTSYIRKGMVLRIPDRDGVFVRPAEGERIEDLSSFYGADGEAVCRVNGIEPGSLLSSKVDVFLPGVNFTAVIQTGDGRIGIAGDKGIKRVNGMLWPLKGMITGQFGVRAGLGGYGSEFHSGLDIAAPAGSAVLSALGGRVAYSGWLGGYGLTVIVEHENGITTLYGHCDDLAVAVGERVSAGQIVSFVGSTGKSTGNHLHFEVRVDNIPVDPLNFLRK